MENEATNVDCAVAQSTALLCRRCKLRSRPDGSSYINASWVQHTVSGAPLRYIATQGPLPDTALHFWQMVVEQASPAVVMVTNGIERGHVKCAQYWPTQPGEVLQLRGLSVTVSSLHVLPEMCMLNMDAILEWLLYRRKWQAHAAGHAGTMPELHGLVQMLLLLICLHRSLVCQPSTQTAMRAPCAWTALPATEPSLPHTT